MDIEFSGVIWEWRGPSPYYFVTVPAKENADLAALVATASHGWGRVPCRVGIGGTEWTTSLWNKDGRYVVPLKDAVRKTEELTVGDEVTVGLAPLHPAADARRAHPPAPRNPDRSARRSGSSAAGPRKSSQVTADQLTIVPANTVSWTDLQAVFGTTGDPPRCWCQRYTMLRGESWASVGRAGLADRLRNQTGCGNPGAVGTSGLVAYLAGEPVGWCAVRPRSDHPRLKRDCRVPWAGRTEDKNDSTVWAVTCFVTRTGFRRRGVSHALARAAVEFSRHHGARALEGYPDLIEISHVGRRSVFADAGFAEVSRPTNRRAVMRIDF